MSRLRILFVDDEVNVLNGLRRSLRPMAAEWDIAFATSAEDALTLLTKQTADAVVSDMRMPGMDGATFLDKVQDLYPRTLRFILSGYSDQESLLRTIGSNHQFMAKPCEAAILVKTLTKALSLRRFLQSDNLRQLIGSLRVMPSSPGVHVQLMKEISGPQASQVKVADIIAHDPGLTTRILQLINSVFFALPKTIVAPIDAVRLLGMDTIRALCIYHGIMSQFSGPELPWLSVNSFSEHCFRVARFAEAIATAEGLPAHVVSETFVSGLLHDIGVIVVAHNIPELYRKLVARMNERRSSLHEEELAVLGATHAEVGAYMLGLWGLPDSVVEVAAHHHVPSRSQTEKLGPLAIVHFANAILGDPLMSVTARTMPHFDGEYLRQMGVNEKLEHWLSLNPEKR